MNRSVLTLWLALALAVAACLAFAAAFDNDFVWDDPIVFQQQLPYFDSAKNVFFPPRSIPQFGMNYYRPLIVVTYQIDEKLAATFWPVEKRNAARKIVYHASCVFYHVLATLGVFALGVTLARRLRAPDRAGPWAAAAAALLFAVHPIHTESVSWMAGRSDVVCGAFLFAALAMYLQHRMSGGLGWFLGFVAAALGAMLSKETGIAIVALVPLLDLLAARLAPAAATAPDSRPAGNRAARRRFQRSDAPAAATPGGLAPAVRYVALAAAVGAYLLLRSTALSGMGAGAPAYKGAAIGPLFGSIGWYVVKLFWPPPQSAFVADIPGGIIPLVGALVPVACAAWIAWAWRKRGFEAEIYGTALFFLALGPSMAIAVMRISETPLAERYLYLPSAGACLALAFAAERLLARLAGRTRLAAGAVALAVVAVPAALATHERNKVWQDDLAFWQATAKTAYEEGIPHLHLGIALAGKKDLEGSAKEYELALKYYDDSEGRAKAHNNLGSTLMQLRRYEEAIDHFRQALEQDRSYSTPHYNWALCLLQKASESKEPAARAALRTEAIARLETALKLNPRYVKAYLALGRELLFSNKRETGVEFLRKVIQLAPASDEAMAARKELARVEKP